MKNLSIALIFSLFFITLIACSGGESSSSGEIKVGSSCAGIGSMEGRLHCSGSDILFCSSFSQYKYKVQSTCPEGQVCKKAADGKSTTCVAK